MASRIRFKRGSLAQIDAAAALGLLVAGEPYYVTDAQRPAVGTSPTTYALLAGSRDLRIGGEEIGYAESTSPFITSSSSLVQIPGLLMSIVIPDAAIRFEWGANCRVIGAGSLTLALTINGAKVAQAVYTGSSFSYVGRTYRMSEYAPGDSVTVGVSMGTSGGTADMYAANDDRSVLLGTVL